MRVHLPLRLAALMTTVLSGTAAIEAFQTGQSTGSNLARAASLAAAIVALLAGIFAIFPTLLIAASARSRTFSGFWSRLQLVGETTSNASSLQPPTSLRFHRLAAVLIALGAFCFAANIFSEMSAPPPINLDDQGAYLDRAQELVSDAGSMFTLPELIQDLRSGTFKEDNRHPLFLGFLALHPTEERGRLLAGLFGSLAFVTGVWMVWRRFSPLTAGLFAVLLGLNHDLAQFSVMVVCETLLLLWVSLAFFAVLPATSSSRSLNSRRFRILAASVCLGLAYMTKGTGLLFFGVFLGWLAWQARPRWDDEIPAEEADRSVVNPLEPYPLRQTVIALLAGVIGFLVVAEPLIERNIRAYGNPFHNVNSLLLFADDYSEFENMLQGGVTTSEAAESYFNSHTLSDMVLRECRGLVWEAFIMLRTLGPQGLDDARVLFGLPIAACCFVGLWFERRPARSLLVAWIITAWVMFAWYVPIAAGDRFPFPLLIAVLAYAAEGLRRMLHAGR